MEKGENEQVRHPLAIFNVNSEEAADCLFHPVKEQVPKFNKTRTSSPWKRNLWNRFRGLL